MMENLGRRTAVYTGGNSTGPFSFAFKVWETTDVYVLVKDTADSSVRRMSPSEYSVTLNEDDAAGGSVTLTSPLAEGGKLQIISNIDYKQPVALENMGAFNPEDLLVAWDRNTALIQQVAEGVKRAVMTPDLSEETPEQFTESIFKARDDAQASASAAAGSASEANESADNAAQSETAAKQALDDTVAAKNSALTEISTAKTSATEAVSSAQATAVQAVQNEGSTQVSAVKSAGSSQVSRIEGAVDEGVGSVSSAGTSAVKSVQEAGTSAIQDVQTEGSDQAAAVKSAGNAQIESIQNEGSTQVSAVTNAGRSQISAVTAEGQRQVSAVTTEGESQIAEIRSIAETATDNATQASQEAEASAKAAASSATAAATSASDANASKSAAASSAAAANSSKTAAASSASAAAGSASAAANSASQAKTWADKLQNPTAEVQTLDPSASATVDVSLDESDTVKWTFGIPKGVKGDKGDKGETGDPGPQGTTGTISSVTASVDSSVGTPSVSVELGGTEQQRTVAFSFSNLKGDKGDRGEKGETGEQGNGLNIKSKFASFEELQSTIPVGQYGDVYSTNDTVPPTIYFWDVRLSKWSSMGAIQGAKGDKGDPGNPGAAGPYFTPSVDSSGNLSWSNNGSLANPSTVNIKGPKGDDGDTGPKGDPFTYSDFTQEQLQGLVGPQGPQGPHFTPSVSSDGVLSWTNNGSLQNPSPVNIKGPKGDNGANGADGAAGPYYKPAVDSSGNLSWTNTGNLVNPSTVNIKGPKGDNGSNGATGPYFTPSVDSAGNLSWTNNGGLSNPGSVNIKGPKGDTGAPGADGTDGAQGPTGATPNITVSASVSASTGTPSVQVSKSGTAEAPTFALSFSGLKGEKGADAVLGTGSVGTANIQDGAVTSEKLASDVAESLNKGGLPLGFLFAWPFQTPPDGAIQCNGATYNRSLYADFYAYISTKGWVKTESEWQSIAGSNNGYCPWYSSGDGSTTFRTPKFAPFMQLAIASSSVGTHHQAGLPNITGSYTPIYHWSGGASLDGAFSAKSGAKYGQGTAGPAAYDGAWDFNASRSSSVYGRSSTVQPESNEWMICVVVAGSATNLGSLDVSNVMSAIATVQAQIPAIVSPEAYVTQTYHSGSSWYRVYNDGFIIQGGYFAPPQSNPKTVSLPKQFSNTNYVIALGILGNTASGGYNSGYKNKSTTSFSLVFHNSGTADENAASWIACGY